MTMTTTMKAMVIRDFGGPERLELADVPRPSPGPGQILVAVKATSVNPVDTKIRRAGAWARVPMPAILGYDAAGVVAELGTGVTSLQVGDEVFYTPHIFGRQGTSAEFHVVEADIVAKKPSMLSFEEAASMPLAAITAWDSIVTFFQTRPGDTVLVHAGAGGVGCFAVQLAKAAGARVLATGRAENEAFIKALGADEVIDYGAGDPLRAAAAHGPFDVVVDCAGGYEGAACRRLLAPQGRHCIVAGDSPRAAMQPLMPPFSSKLILGVPLAKNVQPVMDLIARGEVTIALGERMPLADLERAHALSRTGRLTGKLVMKP